VPARPAVDLLAILLEVLGDARDVAPPSRSRSVAASIPTSTRRATVAPTARTSALASARRSLG
jgi:hypothetical protein